MVCPCILIVSKKDHIEDRSRLLFWSGSFSLVAPPLSNMILLRERQTAHFSNIMAFALWFLKGLNVPNVWRKKPTVFVVWFFLLNGHKLRMN